MLNAQLFNKIQRVIKMIKGEQLNKEDLPQFYRRLFENPNDSSQELSLAQFLFFQKLKNNEELQDPEEFAQFTQLPIDIVEQLFQNEARLVTFPTIREDDHSLHLVSALVIELAKGSGVHTFSNHQLYQKELKILAQATQKDFFVIFDNHFQGSSFMLAIAAALISPHDNLSRYAYSGEVTSDGKIKAIDYSTEKSQFIEEQGKIYLSHEELSHIKELALQHPENPEERAFWLQKGPMPVIYLVIFEKNADKALQGMEELIQELHPFFDLKTFLAFFSLKKEDLLAPTDDPKYCTEKGFLKNEGEVWTPYLNEVLGGRLQKLHKRISQSHDVQFHLAVKIATLALGLGVKMGRLPLYYYHYDNDRAKYIRMTGTEEFDNSFRKIKNVIPSPEMLQFLQYSNLSEPDPEQETALALYFASHNPASEVALYLKHHQLNWNLVSIFSEKYQGANVQGNLPPDSELPWGLYAREIYSLLNMHPKPIVGTRYNLFISLPTPIAFFLGRAMGHFMDISIYHYNSRAPVGEKYFKVFDLPQIDAPF